MQNGEDPMSISEFAFVREVAVERAYALNLETGFEPLELLQDFRAKLGAARALHHDAPSSQAEPAAEAIRCRTVRKAPKGMGLTNAGVPKRALRAGRLPAAAALGLVGPLGPPPERSTVALAPAAPLEPFFGSTDLFPDAAPPINCGIDDIPVHSSAHMGDAMDSALQSALARRADRPPSSARGRGPVAVSEVAAAEPDYGFNSPFKAYKLDGTSAGGATAEVRAKWVGALVTASEAREAAVNAWVDLAHAAAAYSDARVATEVRTHETALCRRRLVVRPNPI